MQTFKSYSLGAVEIPLWISLQCDTQKLEANKTVEE